MKLVPHTVAPTGTCILYQLAPGESVLHNVPLISAQQRALAQQLPFAVVTVVPPTNHAKETLLNLQPAEMYLKKFQIKLLVLVGEPLAAMKNVRHHVKPVAVLDHKGGTVPNAPTTLQQHTHPWPSRVQTVAELSQLKDLIC